jgi:hypothetical protein
MARIQYQPAARSRGFAPPKLSTAAIDRMRDESNRLIQGMERRRRAEREQDRQDLQAMQSNAEYTRDMEEANFKTRLYNEEQKNKQEIANIASNARDKQGSFEILSSIAQFSNTLAKGLTEEANRQTKRNIAQAQIADLGIDQLLAQHDARIAQTNGSIQLNADIREQAARSGEDPLETTTNHVANPAIVGAARQVYENRRALALYNTLMDRASLTEEGLAASNNMDLMRDLQNRVKEDVLITMGNPKAAYLSEALSTIEKGNQQQLQNVRTSQLKAVKAEAREQIKVLYSSGDAEDGIKAWDQNVSIFGYADALDKLDEAIKNAPSEEHAQMLLSLPISRDGKGRSYAEDRPDRVVPVLAERAKLQREAEKAENEQNKLELQELVENNMPAIYADFQRAPHDAMALWTENSAKQFDQPVPTIVKNIYSQALKNNKQDEATNIELLAGRNMLDSGYVNSITDSDNLKLAKRLFEEQQIRKYGEQYPVVEDAIDEISAELAEFSSQFAGDTDTQTEINKVDVAKWFENDLKATGNALVSIKNANDLLKTAHTNDPNNPFAYTDTATGRVYRYLGKVDPEQSQKASYVARVSKNKSLGEVVDQPYLLMGADQVKEASFRSSRGLPMEATDEAMQVADMFGVKLSEVMNAQIVAHNRVTGENVPLITQTPAVQLMDNLPLASAKLFQSGLRNGSKAQMDRALSPFTTQLPRRASMGGDKPTPKEVYDYIRTKGVSDIHAKGILANIQGESAFDPAARGDNGTSGGFFQHHADRFDKLKRAVPDWETNWKGQIDFALQDDVGPAYLATPFDDPVAAADVFMTDYERPAEEVREQRRQLNRTFIPTLGF